MNARDRERVKAAARAALCARPIRRRRTGRGPMLPGEKFRKRPKYPIVAKSLGCATGQIGELKEALRQGGVTAEVTPDGNPIVTSDRHRRKVARALGARSPQDYVY